MEGKELNIPILFITYNRLGFTKKSLVKLLKSCAEKIIIIDNYSTDGTVEWLMSHYFGDRVKIILNDRNEGIAGAMNKFFEITKDCEYVAKVDNDTIVPKGWLLKLKNVADKADIIQCRHPLIVRGQTGLKGFDRWCEETMKRVDGCDDMYIAPYIGGSGIIIKRKIVKEKLPETDWKIGGWCDWQLNHPEVKKAFYTGITIQLLDTDEMGHCPDLYPDYYKETGRL